jgi:16S rRNA (guanine527-N7)-methyltransferase
LANDQGLNPTAEQTAGLAAFAELFLEWNARINLGGRISASELIERHYLDAFAASRVISQGRVVADVGSGGGLPSIPLALVRPDLGIQLHEPTGKKVAFLRTAVRELGLKEQVQVHAGRVSADNPAPHALFDVAMSRATFAPRDWLGLGRRMVHAGGLVIVFATGAGDLLDPPLYQRHYAPDRWLLAYGAAASVGQERGSRGST